MLRYTSLFLLLSLVACTSYPDEPEFDNPIMPDDPNYEPPSVTFSVAPEEESTVDTCSVLLAWVGNQPGMSYSYKLNNEDYSNWAGDTSVIYPYLDEGQHTFWVKGRYPSGIEIQAPLSVSFVVDDIQGPALWLFPRFQELDQGSSFTIEVILEEVRNVAGVKAALQFDPIKVQVTNIEVYEDARSLLRQNGGVVVPFSSHDNNIGKVTIEVGTATGSPLGVDGTGAIAKLTFTGIQAGLAEIKFHAASEIRDPNNTTVTLEEISSAKVEVQ